MNNAPHLMLDVTLQDVLNFDSFIVEDCNLWPVEQLKQAIIESRSESMRQIIVYGNTGSGKTHLCHSLVRFAHERSVPATSMSGRHFGQYQSSDSEALMPPNRNGVLLVDDLETISGTPTLEKVLFLLLEEGKKDRYATIMFCQSFTPSLEDLTSRIENSLLLNLQALSDEMLAILIERKCTSRGLVISKSVVAYMIKHLPRDGKNMQHALNRLDRYSLGKRSKIVTIPQIKAVLST